jgi:hypothetical protein
VDAAVGAACDDELDVAPQNGAQRRAELAGNRPPAGLLRPAREGAAIVSEEEARRNRLARPDVAPLSAGRSRAPG